ncbi:MAG: bifunctional proline dehydrogenase/L-glutamate gamma-semialdehyde dehydrogenase [Deltaproteobacteria bacterium]|nr:bifunctional proline dehydrogenase/L-glutamate gamma-semialdehyde dehydrogenase [Deltaproteobacteria bacterium]
MVSEKLEPAIREIGERLLARMGDAKPGMFGGEGLTGRLMEWSMKNDAFKTEMFRFVDVFPVLRDATDMAQHIREYFLRPEQSFGFLGAAMGFAASGIGARMSAGMIEKSILNMARRFIAGATPIDAVATLKTLRDAGIGFTVDLLGEATVSESEAETYVSRYAELVETLASETAAWPENNRLEKAPWGTIPRVNVSVKISALYSQIDAIDFDGSVAILKERVRPIFRKARTAGAFVNIDAEQFALRDVTTTLFRELLDEPEFRDFDQAGIAVQAYLCDSHADIEALIKWAKRRGTPVTVRLVKGAYWDYETVMATQRGWPSPVFATKGATDASFEACALLLLDHAKVVRTAIGSHNVRSIASARAVARALKVPESALEFQMLFGMAEPVKQALIAEGFRVRDYAPVGELLPGMAYFVRRLLENTSNEGWLRKRFAEGVSAAELLARPREDERRPAMTPSAAIGFRNEPPIDFAAGESRRNFAAALASQKRGVDIPIVIGGEEKKTLHTIVSSNPARSGDVIGTSASATADDAREALTVARSSEAAWRETPVATRAAILRRTAEILRVSRVPLAALVVAEAGKPWREADAEVCEAIDFLEYYATQAERLFAPQKALSLPGEDNVYAYQPRGTGVVIAPWNFPLALLCGMTAAALVTGNTVVIKPAEQTPVIAWRLFEAFRVAKLPKGVLGFLPGVGEEVGAALVADPRADFVVFTGSRDVGLGIVRTAADVRPGQRGVRRVIAEMGGKNAIIVDADADLDEAVAGVVRSAFDYAGQKCSACSRVVVVGDVYTDFIRRLVGATESVAIGDPAHPRTRVGPVIDENAAERIRHAIDAAKAESHLAYAGRAPSIGSFVAPHIFTDVSPTSRLAQDEIFGPVLAVIRADSFDAAIEIANGTAYALTGGLFSRSPGHIEQARQAFRVGNLYLNRGITGALVARQPFGGFKMSGVGSKAGGPDYLAQFVEPVCITENTMRRGFAPELLT